MFSQNTHATEALNISRHTAGYHLYKNDKYSIWLETYVCLAVKNESIPQKKPLFRIYKFSILSWL